VKSIWFRLLKMLQKHVFWVIISLSNSCGTVAIYGLFFFSTFSSVSCKQTAISLLSWLLNLVEIRIPKKFLVSFFILLDCCACGKTLIDWNEALTGNKPNNNMCFVVKSHLSKVMWPQSEKSVALWTAKKKKALATIPQIYLDWVIITKN
jgi:hypothetical protein